MANLTSIQVVVLGIFDEWDGVQIGNKALGFGPINRVAIVSGEGDSPYTSAVDAIRKAKERSTADNVVVTNIEHLSKAEHLNPMEWRHYSLAILSGSRTVKP